MQYIGRILAQALHLDTTSKQVETVLHHLYPVCQAAAIMHCLPQPQQATPQTSQTSQQQQPVIIINKACDDTFESPRGVSSA
jgi:hypothetical protein